MGVTEEEEVCHLVIPTVGGRCRDPWWKDYEGILGGDCALDGEHWNLSGGGGRWRKNGVP